MELSITIRPAALKELQALHLNEGEGILSVPLMSGAVLYSLIINYRSTKGRRAMRFMTSRAFLSSSQRRARTIFIMSCSLITTQHWDISSQARRKCISTIYRLSELIKKKAEPNWSSLLFRMPKMTEKSAPSPTP